MRVIERRIQRVRAGMRDRVMDLEKRFAEAEAPYGRWALNGDQTV